MVKEIQEFLLAQPSRSVSKYRQRSTRNFLGALVLI